MAPTSERCANFTYDELNIMIVALEKDVELVTNVLGKSIKNAKEQSERWDAVADLVNSVGQGRERKGTQIRKKWNSMKSETKRKAAKLKMELGGTGGGEVNYELHLTNLEYRVLQLIGKCSYEGISNCSLDLAAPNVLVPEITISTPSSSHLSKSSTPYCSPIPSTSFANPSQSYSNPQPFSTPTVREAFCTTEYNDVITEHTSMLEEDNECSFSGTSNKENENSWVLGPKKKHASSGAKRKSESRARKRKIFDETDEEKQIMQTQRDIRDCLISLKGIQEKQMTNQDRIIDGLKTVADNQERILSSLDALQTEQKNTNVLLQTIAGVQIISE